MLVRSWSRVATRLWLAGAAGNGGKHPNQLGSTVLVFPQYRSLASSPKLISVISERDRNSRLDILLHRFHLNPDRTVNPNANKWIQLALACTNHVCMGSVFALSVFNSSLIRLQGVIVPAAADWLLGDVVTVFTLVMGGFGWGAVFAKYHDRVGLRACGILSATSLLTGFSISAAAVHVHSLPLLYVGGLVWGMGIGWGYVPAVANALRWFPEKKGFAGGATVAGFGAGSILAAPLFRNLLLTYQVAPSYIGPPDMEVTNAGGRLFANGVEAVACFGNDAAAWHIAEGYYAVGTGTCGVAETFMTCGLLYSSVVGVCALFLRAPARTDNATKLSADISEKQWSPQFALMGAGFGLASIGSYALLSTGHTMLMEVYGSRLPELVTPAAGAAFISALGTGNLVGRLLWPNLSDHLVSKHGVGNAFACRRQTFTLMWTLSPIAYMGVLASPYCAGTVAPLAMFTGCAVVAIANLGGAAATRPAFVADTWGPQVVSALVARQMPVLLAAAYVGPRMMTHCRETAISRAAEGLAAQVDPTTFEKTFHAPKEELAMLLHQKTVTLPRLLEICGPDVIDPTPYLYSEGLTICILCQLGALATNVALNPRWGYIEVPKAVQEEVVRELDNVAVPEELQKIHRRFQQADLDDSGTLSYDEFLKMVLQKPDSVFTKRLFDIFDTDKNGKLSLNEFVVGINVVTSALHEDKMKFAFMLYDRYGTGGLEMGDIVEILKAQFILTGVLDNADIEHRAKLLFDQAGLEETASISLDQFLEIARWNPGLLAPGIVTIDTIEAQLIY